MATELPSTENGTVMRMAVAWHIVLATHNPHEMRGTHEDNRITLTDAYIATYNAMLANEQTEVDSPISISFGGRKKD